MAQGRREGWTAVEVRVRRCVRGTHGGRSGMRVVSVVEDRFRLRRRVAALLPKGAARKCVRLGIHHAQTSSGDEEKKISQAPPAEP